MASQRKRVPWSHWDRLLMIVLGLILILVVGFGLWSHALEENPVVSVPEPQMPNPNAYDDFQAAGYAIVKYVKPVKAAGGPAAPPLTLSDEAQWVRLNPAPLQLVRAGLTHPYLRPPIRSFDTMLPEYAQARTLARLLAWQGELRAAHGDRAGAMDADLDAVQLGEMLPHGATLLGPRVGSECEDAGRHGTWAAVARLNAPQARAAARRLEQIRRLHVPFSATLQEQKWFGQAALSERMRQRNWRFTLLRDLSDGGPCQALTSNPYCRDTGGASWATLASSKRSVMANYGRIMDAAIQNASLPYAAAAAAFSQPADPYSAGLLSFLGEAPRLWGTDADAQNALLLVTLALRAYELDHRAYPAALSALVPVYLKAVPDDPFALSGPTLYKR